MDHLSKKINLLINCICENETIYHMKFDSDSLPRLQEMIYNGEKEGRWIRIDEDYANVNKIILQQYKNDIPVKKNRMLFVLKNEIEP